MSNIVGYDENDKINDIIKSIDLEFRLNLSRLNLRNKYLTQIVYNERCLEAFKRNYEMKKKRICILISLNNDVKVKKSVNYFIRNFKPKIEYCNIALELNKKYTLSTPLYFKIFNLQKLSINGTIKLRRKDYRALLGSYSNQIDISLSEDNFSGFAGLGLEHMPNNPKLRLGYGNLCELYSLLGARPSIFTNVQKISFYSQVYGHEDESLVFKKRLFSSILRYKTKFMKNVRATLVSHPPIEVKLNIMFDLLKT